VVSMARQHRKVIYASLWDCGKGKTKPNPSLLNRTNFPYCGCSSERIDICRFSIHLTVVLPLHDPRIYTVFELWRILSRRPIASSSILFFNLLLTHRVKVCRLFNYLWILERKSLTANCLLLRRLLKRGHAQIR